MKKFWRLLTYAYLACRWPSSDKMAWTFLGLWSLALATVVMVLAATAFFNSWSITTLLNVPTLALDGTMLVASIRGLYYRRRVRAGCATL